METLTGLKVGTSMFVKKVIGKAMKLSSTQCMKATALAKIQAPCRSIVPLTQTNMKAKVPQESYSILCC